MAHITSQRNTAPGVALVTATQAKRWLHREDDDDIEDIELLIAAAMSHLDGVTGILRRALISQEWADIWDGFSTYGSMPLILTPVLTVESINYYDAANTVQTLSENSYSLHQDFAGSYFRLASGAAWPTTYDRDDAVTVNYRAGYGASAADVPAEIRLAARELVENWYNCDGDISDKMPSGIMTKLRRFIRPHF